MLGRGRDAKYFAVENGLTCPISSVRLTSPSFWLISRLAEGKSEWRRLDSFLELENWFLNLKTLQEVNENVDLSAIRRMVEE